MTDKKNLLAKIKQLAEKGAYGEKANAENLLMKLKTKYGITDIDTEEFITCELAYKSTVQRLLIGQVAYAVTGKEGTKYNPKKRVVKIKCTPAQKIEICEMVKFYLRAYEKDLAIFYRAFIEKNDIYPAECENLKAAELTEENKQMLKLAHAMQKHEYLKAIGGAK